MPISNKGTSLKVVTNINGTIYHDEEVRDVYYNRNMQAEQRREPAGKQPGDMKAFGRNVSAPEVEEFQMPEDMAKVIADDLTDKGVSATPKRKRSTKKTTKTTEQTND